MSDATININFDTLIRLADSYHFFMLGDRPSEVKGRTDWDLGFLNLTDAVNFWQAVSNSAHAFNIRKGHSVTDMNEPVEFTLVA